MPSSFPHAPQLVAPSPWDYHAPVWVPGGHAQTIAAALWARRFWGDAPLWARERWTTPDGDFVDVDRLHATGEHPTSLNGGMPTPRPLLVLFHGLEGSSGSAYALATADVFTRAGWDVAVPHFRGCSGEPNFGPRAYHSGDHEEIDWLLRRFRAESPSRPVFAMGVSLGGNALMRWAGEHGTTARDMVGACVAVCSPLDLTASGHAIGRGLNRQLYTRMFLRTMVPRARAKLRQHPGLFDEARLNAARDLYDFDNVFTAPLHGFANTEAYWRLASAKPLLGGVKVPALLLNALNDPFVPAQSLPRGDEVSHAVTLWQPQEGGHVGFPAVARWGARTVLHVTAMPRAVLGWLNPHLDRH